MSENLIIIKPIGIIHTPFSDHEGTPIQPAAARQKQSYDIPEGARNNPSLPATEAWGRVEVFPEYEKGLKDLDGFERIILVFQLHKICREELVVHPYLDPENPHGVFATRSPCRPNRIGISCVKLVKVEKNILHVEEVDILDGTPLMDIKPYVPQFDCFGDVKAGWIGDADVTGRKADARFR